MKNFALIGATGYIAPRHLKAIVETGNNLIVALDKNDSAGILDQFFPNADFFTEFERFDRHIEKLSQSGDCNKKIDYVSICTPNYLHDSHIRFSLRSGAHAICEKPLVLNPWNVEALINSEKRMGRNIFNILQLRLHPSMIKFKDKVSADLNNKKYNVDLTYITSRGKWYLHSWKGVLEKSGGIATNIGIHFFDILGWIFGEVQENILHVSEVLKASGYLEFERARVRWFLSIDENDLPKDLKINGRKTYRSLKCDGEEVEFSTGFENLHTKSYQRILNGEGFRPTDSKQSIDIVYRIRNTRPKGVSGDYHPLNKSSEQVSFIWS